MSQGKEGTLNTEFLRRLLKAMADMDLSEEAAEMQELLAGLVSTMNTLQPEAYAEVFPASTFRPIKE